MEVMRSHETVGATKESEVQGLLGPGKVSTRQPLPSHGDQCDPSAKST